MLSDSQTNDLWIGILCYIKNIQLDQCESDSWTTQLVAVTISYINIIKQLMSVLFKTCEYFIKMYE